MQRRAYAFQIDQGPGHPFLDDDDDFRLPENAAMLPKNEAFSFEKSTRLALHKLALKIRAPFFLGMPSARRLDTDEDYMKVLAFMRRPPAAKNWKTDEEFGRQRLEGTNPMAIRHCAEPLSDELAKKAARVLADLYQTKLKDAEPRLFHTLQREVLEPCIQSQVFHGATLPGARCLFFATDQGTLMPIAIELENREGARCVRTPLDEPPIWLLAKAHANAVDTHYHEGVYHLLETHMVSEVFKIATCRHLHPDHPLHQLLDPHFEDNLAIDHLARNNLLSPGGPIDITMTAGVGGTLDLARIHWKRWSFEDRRFQNELASRKLDDDKYIEFFPYRDDGKKLHGAIADYVSGVLGVWYRTSADVVGDFELQGWASELAPRIPDFPREITSTRRLFGLVADVVFRASVQHSAVNNGQFDNYGFVPNSPGTMFRDIPREELSLGLTERDVFRAMPRLKRAQAQLGMCWVLSQPTHRSLYASGECPAFSQELSLAAYERVQAFRERLREISSQIEERNRSLVTPYTYLNPHNVGRSTGI